MRTSSFLLPPYCILPTAYYLLLATYHLLLACTIWTSWASVTWLLERLIWKLEICTSCTEVWELRLSTLQSSSVAASQPKAREISARS